MTNRKHKWERDRHLSQKKDELQVLNLELEQQKICKILVSIAYCIQYTSLTTDVGKVIIHKGSNQLLKQFQCEANLPRLVKWVENASNMMAQLGLAIR